MDSDEKLAIKLFWWLPVVTFILGMLFSFFVFKPIVYIVDPSSVENEYDPAEYNQFFELTQRSL